MLQPAAAVNPANASLRAVKGLDALRAFAIIGVVAYHLMPNTVPGGYLGVDIFLVISGFLITGGLVRAWERNVARQASLLRDFYQKRFNRIVPSLVVVLLFCTTIALAVGGDVLVGVDKQLIGAVSFTSNWMTIAAGGDYFAATTPALFANLWYLALNVQFYLIWPLILVGLFGLARSGKLRVSQLWAWALGIGIASAALMFALSFVGAGQTRMYEGTDTHFFSLMFGSALALGFAYNSATLVRLRNRVSAPVAGRLGWLTGCVLLGLYFILPWVSVASFRGLMVFAAILSSALVFLLVSFPVLGTMLERPGLKFVGEHSYGIFLWHWPLLIIVSGAFGLRYDQPPWWLILAVVCLSVGLTLVGEKLVNAPVASLGLRGYFQRVWHLPRLVRVGIAGVLVVGFASTGAAFATAPSESLITRQILAGAAQAAQSQLASQGRQTALARQTTWYQMAWRQELTWGGEGSDEAATSSQVPATPTNPLGAPTGEQVTAVGDSVLLGATPQLMEQLPGVYIDGAISRQFYHAVPILQELKEAGELRTYVLVALATNGTITSDWVDQLMDVVGPDRMVLLVTGYGNRVWIPDANAALAAAVDRYPGRVTLIDWNGLAASDTSLLGGDGIHPNDAGMERYAALVVQTLSSLESAGAASSTQETEHQDLYLQ